MVPRWLEYTTISLLDSIGVLSIIPYACIGASHLNTLILDRAFSKFDFRDTMWLRDRVSAQCAMDRRIDPSWWTHCAISNSSQCSTTGTTKAVLCANLMIYIKDPLMPIEKGNPIGGDSWIYFPYLSAVA